MTPSLPPPVWMVGQLTEVWLCPQYIQLSVVGAMSVNVVGGARPGTDLFDWLVAAISLSPANSSSILIMSQSSPDSPLLNIRWISDGNLFNNIEDNNPLYDSIGTPRTFNPLTCVSTVPKRHLRCRLAHSVCVSSLCELTHSKCPCAYWQSAAWYRTISWVCL